MIEKIGGILISEKPSAEETKKQAEKMKNCPYLVVLGTSTNRIFSIFIVPKDKRWWLEYPTSNLAATRSGSRQLFLVENVEYPEKFNLRIPAKKTEITPCGDNCSTCPLRNKYNCKGCPATIHYRE